MTNLYLGVNVDHVGTLRNARGTTYPSPVEAACLAEKAGADSITIHLREDRRHIIDQDVFDIAQAIKTRLNLEIALTDEMIAIALEAKPHSVCFVPEKREELTTEGGLDVVKHASRIQFAVDTLQSAGIAVSLFVDPNPKQVEASANVKAAQIELHTGDYANAPSATLIKRVEDSAVLGKQAQLQVNAGHGLTLDNVAPIARIPQISELNIGHSIIAHSVFVGLEKAVQAMKHAMEMARAS
jgi:pyridoxine 5-phosphate synthase